MYGMYFECQELHEGNSEVTTQKFSLQSNYNIKTVFKKMKQETIFLWLCTSMQTDFSELRGLGRTFIYATPPTYCSIHYFKFFSSRIK